MIVRDRPGVVRGRPEPVGQKLPTVARAKLVSALANALAKARQRIMPAPLTVLEMVGTYTIISNAIMVAARLGIADLLKGGPKSAEELAEAVDARPQPLYRLLRALTNVGVFAQDDDARFRLTPISRCLLADSRTPCVPCWSCAARSGTMIRGAISSPASGRARLHSSFFTG